MAIVWWPTTATHALALGRAIALPLLLSLLIFVSVKVQRSSSSTWQMACLHVLEKAPHVWKLQKWTRGCYDVWPSMHLPGQPSFFFLLFFFFSSLLFFFSSSLPACIPPQQHCLSLPDESSFTCFLSGMNPITNSRNCTCQQSSVNRRDQCVCAKVSGQSMLAGRFKVLYACRKDWIIHLLPQIAVPHCKSDIC